MRRKKLLSLTVFLTAFTMSFYAPFAASATDNPKEKQNVPRATFNNNISQGDIVIAASGEPPTQVCPGGDDCLGHVISGTTGKDSGKPNTIVIESGEHNITLSDLKIYANAYTDPDDPNDSGGSDQSKVCAFRIQDNAKVNLTLEGKNILASGTTCAGLFVPEKAALTITEESTGTLIANGGSGGAGIGSDAVGSSGEITINGGTIKANGGTRSAGIGGAPNAGFKSITINGGTVEATGGMGITGGNTDAYKGGAGIGCGAGSTGGSITISGGNVTALGGVRSATDPSRAAGINCMNLLADPGSSASIVASNLHPSVGTRNFNGIIWDAKKKEGKVYGQATIKEDLDAQTLNIGPGCILTIDPGHRCFQ